MKSPKLIALGLALALFVAVYAPAFIAVSVLRAPALGAVPLIIGVSLAIALALIFALARRPAGVAEFGLASAQLRYIGMAVVIGLPLALIAAWLGHLFPAKSPISTAGFPAWAPWLCFGLGASVQEEVIFRGLVQSILARGWPTPPGRWLSAAVVITAVLFGVVHLDSGPAVALAAVALGLVAGELRRRSGSLLPAIVVHALFNLPDLIWT